MTPQTHRLDPPTKQGPQDPEERIIIRGGKPLHGGVYVARQIMNWDPKLLISPPDRISVVA